MELGEAILGRRSVRRYTDEVVPRGVLEKIIEAGRWAPTACNVQGFRFLVIDDPQVFDRIIKGGAAGFLKKVRQAILVLYDNQTDNVEYHDYVQSAAAGIQNMLLTAHSLKVGTCWVNHLPRKNYLRRVLGIPYYLDPIALVTLGYFDQKTCEMPRRRELSDVVCYNEYSIRETVHPKKRLALIVKRLARKIYFFISAFDFLRKIANRIEKKFEN